METPLRGRSGGHAGTAPTVSFGWSVHGWLISLERMVRKWLFCLCGIAWKNMMEIGRGGACVPARVALQGRIHHLPPHAQCVYFWYGNAAVRTFGRAHRHRPYGFVWWIACGRLAPFGGIARGRLVAFGWIVCKWLLCLCGIAWKNMMEFGRGGACVPARVALQGRIHR